MSSTTEQATSAATKPSVHPAGEDDDHSIERFELAAAHRALALLKGTLGRDRLLHLLCDEIAAGETFLRTHVGRSAGQETTGTTILQAHGLSSAQFTGWLGQAFGREDVLLAGHPGHYSIHASAGRVNIVETLGDHVCSFFMQPWNDALALPAPAPDGTPPTTRRSRILLEDGTIVGSITNTFRDEGDGFTAHLSVTLPLTCGEEVVEHHLQHFAVEFHNWILSAAREQHDG